MHLINIIGLTCSMATGATLGCLLGWQFTNPQYKKLLVVAPLLWLATLVELVLYFSDTRHAYYSTSYAVAAACVVSAWTHRREPDWTVVGCLLGFFATVFANYFYVMTLNQQIVGGVEAFILSSTVYGLIQLLDDKTSQSANGLQAVPSI